MATIEILEPAGQVQKLAPLQLNPVPQLAGCRLARSEERRVGKECA